MWERKSISKLETTFLETQKNLSDLVGSHGMHGIRFITGEVMNVNIVTLKRWNALKRSRVSLVKETRQMPSPVSYLFISSWRIKKDWKGERVRSMSDVLIERVVVMRFNKVIEMPINYRKLFVSDNYWMTTNRWSHMNSRLNKMIRHESDMKNDFGDYNWQADRN